MLMWTVASIARSVIIECSHIAALSDQSELVEARRPGPQQGSKTMRNYHSGARPAASGSAEARSSNSEGGGSRIKTPSRSMYVRVAPELSMDGE